MKKICVFLAPAAFFLVFLLLFISCDRECVCTYPEEPDEQAPEYHLIYGPAGSYPGYIMTYSTKTGELLDSTPYGDYYYFDFRFTSDGTKAVYVGAPWDYYFTLVIWIEDYPSGEILGALELYITNWAKRIHINDGESHVLITFGGIFAVYSFPQLNLVHMDTVHNDGGGFLPGGNRAFYFDEEIDSLFIVDFSNPDSVSTTSIPVRYGDLVIYPEAATVDYDNRRMTLVSYHSENRSYIQVLDTDSLTVTQQLQISIPYDCLSIHPNADYVYCSHRSSAYNVTNRIDLYNIGSNTLQPFLGLDDFVSIDPFMPRMVEFTPDGNMMYILSGGGLYSSPILGVRLADKLIVQFIKPSGAGAQIIRINPLNYSIE